eukprot:gene11671-4907_t
MNQNNQLLICAGASSLVGLVGSTIYQFHANPEKTKHESYTQSLIQNLIATLPSSLLIPSTIKQSFINIYCLENPALITYLYGICKTLPSLFGITLGRALMLISATKIYTSSTNRLMNLISSLLGFLVYYYSKKYFSSSILNGNLNVFNGSIELNEMGDAETRIYKAMVRNMNDKDVDFSKFLNLNEKLSEILKTSPQMFSILEDDEILNPFYVFIDKELKILDVSSKEMDSISPSEIQSKLKIKGGGMVKGIDRVMKKTSNNIQLKEKNARMIEGYTQSFTEKYQENILKEFKFNYFARYAIPTCISLTFDSSSMSLTNKSPVNEEEEEECFSPLRLPRNRSTHDVDDDILIIEPKDSENIKKVAYDTVKIVTSRDRTTSSPEIFSKFSKKKSTSPLTSPSTTVNRKLSLSMSNFSTKKKLFAPSPTRQELDTYSSQRRKASVEIMKLEDILQE